MAPKQEIVVTGVGVVSPIGIGEESVLGRPAEGRSGIRRLDLSDDPTCRRRSAAPWPISTPKQYVRPRKSLKVMSRDIQLAFAAADLACVDAGLREQPVDPERLGVVFGAGLIPGELDELAGTYRGCMWTGSSTFAAGARRRWPSCFRSGC